MNLAPLTVCASCGVIAAHESKCSHCNKVHEGRPLTIPPRDDGAVWVCVECTFRCRSCGFAVPLNQLDMDGAVVCVRCGTEQAFEVARWRQALGHAHSAGDLSGDRAEGIPKEKNPFRTVGTSRTGIKLAIEGANALEITASPGHPLCERCRAPLEITFDPAARSRAACKSCDESAEYVVPAAARKMTRALHAIVATEHRADRAEVSVEATDAAITVKCPNCSAPLPIDQASKFLTCRFCNTSARIPDRTWARVRGGAPAVESMWLLFQGPSPLRQETENRKAKDEADARLHAEKEAMVAERERIQTEARNREYREEEERRQRAAAAEIAEQERRALAEKDARKRMRVVTTVVVAVVAIALGVISFLGIRP
jgi:hypothetical protein